MGEGIDESVVFDFVFRYLQDREGGEVHGLAHYLARFPGHDEAIASEFVELGRAEQLPVRDADEASPEAAHVDHYRIRRVLGEGGQAVVYLAEDLRLGRDVALKMLSPTVGWSDTTKRTRFRREAETLSRLNHPGICDVYEAALDGERPYIAMRYVEGETLAQRLRVARARGEGTADEPTPDHTLSGSVECAPRGSVELGRLLRLFEKAARALHAAHEAGVVHRDVKPGNIVVDAEGDPVLLDFGFARWESNHPEDLTLTGVVFGTPAYMAPEQVAGRRADVDRRSDVYSLGVTLYECLTLDKSRRVAAMDGVRNRPLDPALAEDLRLVLETALEPERERRYATALELAEDLRRVLAYEPIQARPTGRWLRLRRWTQRNPALAAGLFGSLFFLSAGLIASFVLVSELEQALTDLEGSYYRELAGREPLPERALLLAIEAARKEPGLESNRVLVGALERLTVLRRIPLAPLRDGSPRCCAPADRSWAALTDGAGLSTYTLPGLERLASIAVPDAFSVDVSPDGAVVAVGTTTGAIRLYAGRGALPLRRLEAHDDCVAAVRFSPDGTLLASASLDGFIRIWRSGTWERGARLEHTPGAPIVNLSWSPDGRHVVSRQLPITFPTGSSARTADSRLWIWDVDTGQCVARLDDHDGDVTNTVFDPSGRRLATTSKDGTVILWDTESWRPLWRERRSGKTHSVSFHPDGHRLALAWDPDESRVETGAAVLDTRTGAEIFDLRGHEDRAVSSIEYSPDGARIATGSFDGTTRIWDALEDSASSSRALSVTRGRLPRDSQLLWTPDGTAMLELAADAARLIRVAPAHTFPEYPGNEGQADLVGAELDAAGRHVLTADADGRLRVFDRAGECLARSRHDTAPLACAAFLGDGAAVVSAATDRSLRVWDWRHDTVRWTEQPAASTDVELAMARSRHWLVLADAGGAVRVLDRATGEIVVRPVPVDVGLTCVAVSDDERWIAAGTDDRGVVLYAGPDFAAPRAVRVEGGSGGVRPATDVAFDAAGHLVSAFESGMLHVQDVLGERAGQRFGTTFGRLAPAPRGELFAATLWGGGVQCFTSLPDIEGSSPARTRRLHLSAIRDLRLDRTGELVATASADGTCSLSDAATLLPLVSYRHPSTVEHVAFSPDGAHVLTTCSDGVVRLLPVDPLAAALAAAPCDWSAVGGRPSADGR